MKRSLLLGCLSVACVSGAPPAGGTGDAGAKGAASRASPPPLGPEPDLREARYFARRPGTHTERDLKVDGFSVEVSTGTHAIRSRLDIIVKNPGNEQVEAVMRLPIPPGAAVTRAVLFVGERPMAGAFVARERARDIYRAITERRRDPALITWHGPDWIDVSVFPVEANDRRRIQLEWLEPTALKGETVWYRIPVLAHEGRAVVRPDTIMVDGSAIARLGRTWLPIVQMKTPAAAAARVPGDPFGYLFSPAGPPAREPLRLVLVAETSRAMTNEDRARQREAIDALLTTLPSSARLSLLSADFALQVLAESLLPQQMAQALDRLDGIVSAGALDLEHALAKASEVAQAQGSKHIVFLGHGNDAFGGDSTSAPLARLQDSRQTLVLVGGDDRALALGDVAALTGGVVLSWAQAISIPARALWGIAGPPATPTMPGLERFFPLETVTGETRWLARFVGEAPAGAARARARDLEALWARAHVLGTTSRDTDEGVRHQVLTPLTSLLVLETMADYARWGIPAPDGAHLGKMGASEGSRAAATGGILGVLRLSALGSSSGEAAPDGLPGNEVGDALGLGGLGLVDAGMGGGGTGERTFGLGNFGGYGRGGIGLAGHRASAPGIVPGTADVRGSLDKEIIRRIIRRHLNEVRYCYEQELARTPDLEGRVSVQLTIGATGQVLTSVLRSSTMGSAQVERCVVQAARRWEFPRTSGSGITIVTYPFNFVGGGRLDRRPVVQTAPDTPDDRWQVALTELRKPGERKARVARAAQVLGAPAADTPAFLAWWLFEQRLRQGGASPAAYFLIAELLRDAGQVTDAVRLLSEIAPHAPVEVEAEYRRWGRKDDADRLKHRKAR